MRLLVKVNPTVGIKLEILNECMPHYVMIDKALKPSILPRLWICRSTQKKYLVSKRIKKFYIEKITLAHLMLTLVFCLMQSPPHSKSRIGIGLKY